MNDDVYTKENTGFKTEYDPKLKTNEVRRFMTGSKMVGIKGFFYREFFFRFESFALSFV